MGRFHQSSGNRLLWKCRLSSNSRLAYTTGGLAPTGCVNSELFSCEKWLKGCIPSGKLTWQWKMDQLKMYSLIENGDFPLAMLVYRSVIIYCISFPFRVDLNQFTGLMSKFLRCRVSKIIANAWGILIVNPPPILRHPHGARNVDGIHRYVQKHSYFMEWNLMWSLDPYMFYIFQLQIHSDFIHQPHLSGRLGQFCLHFPTLRKDASPKRDLDNEVVWEWAPRHPDQKWWKKKLKINLEASKI